MKINKRINPFSAITKPGLVLFGALFLLIFPQSAQAIPAPEIASQLNTALLQIVGLAGASLACFGIFIKKSLPKKKLIPIIVRFYLLFTISLSSAITIAIAVDTMRAQEDLYRQFDNYSSTFMTMMEKRKNINSLNYKVPTIDMSELASILKEYDPEKYLIFDARKNQREYELAHIKNAVYWEEPASVDPVVLDDFYRLQAESIKNDLLVVFYCDFAVRSARIADRFFKYHANTILYNDYSFAFYMLGEENNILDHITGQCGNILTPDQASRLYATGVSLVDVRNKNDFITENRLIGTDNIPILEIGLKTLVGIIKKIDPELGMATVCYDLASCEMACYFNATINTFLKKNYGFSHGVVFINDPRKL